MKKLTTRDRILAFRRPAKKKNVYQPPWAGRVISAQLEEVDEALFAIDRANRVPEGYYGRSRHRSAGPRKEER